TQNIKTNGNYFKQGAEEEEYMVLNLQENTDNRLLRFGLHFHNLYKSGALVNITEKKLLFKNDGACLECIFGDNIRYNFNDLIDNGLRWSFGMQSRLNKFKYNVKPYDKDFLTDQIFLSDLFNADWTDLTHRLFLQNYHNDKFLIGLGLEHKYQIADI